jgi:hypothetical protein
MPTGVNMVALLAVFVIVLRLHAKNAVALRARGMMRLKEGGPEPGNGTLPPLF